MLILLSKTKTVLEKVMKNQIEKAVQLLNNEEVIGLPTETVYGLAARIDSLVAIEKIFKIKERPFFDPLIVHVANIEQAKSIVKRWPEIAGVLAEKFWPGPLTLVLLKNDKVHSMITSGLETVALRMPRHSIAAEIIQKVNCPLAAPSANKFGKTSPTCAEHVRQEFKKEDVFVVDGGQSEVGLESTILLIHSDLKNISILREGLITRSQIQQTLDKNKIIFQFIENQNQASPGNMKHHYMPSVPFVIFQKEPNDLQKMKEIISEKMNELPNVIDEVKIIKPKKIEKLERLNLSNDPILASREFYSELRKTAEKKPDIIFFVLTDQMSKEPWLALTDRMTKAASLSI